MGKFTKSSLTLSAYNEIIGLDVMSKVMGGEHIGIKKVKTYKVKTKKEKLLIGVFIALG